MPTGPKPSKGRQAFNLFTGNTKSAYPTKPSARIDAPGNTETPAQISTARRQAQAIPGYNTGIDWVELSVPIHYLTPDRGWDFIIPVESGNGESLGWQAHKQLAVSPWGMPARLEVKARTPVSPRAVAIVSFNPSSLCAGPPWALARIEDVVDTVLPAVWDAIKRWVKPACRIEEAGVRRLDVAQNLYDVSEPSVILYGLQPLRRRYGAAYKQGNVLYSDNGRPETLRLGGGNTGHVVLYDKKAELVSCHGISAGDVPDGLMRLEVQARAPWAGRFGAIRKVSDLNRLNVERLFRNRASWALIEETIMDESGIHEVLNLMAQKHPRKFTYQIRWELEESLLSLQKGRGLTGSRNTLTARRALRDEAGIALMPQSAKDRGISRRLDLREGREIRGDAQIFPLPLLPVKDADKPSSKPTIRIIPKKRRPA